MRRSSYPKARVKRAVKSGKLYIGTAGRMGKGSSTDFDYFAVGFAPKKNGIYRLGKEVRIVSGNKRIRLLKPKK